MLVMSAESYVESVLNRQTCVEENFEKLYYILIYSVLNLITLKCEHFVQFKLCVKLLEFHKSWDLKQKKVKLYLPHKIGYVQFTLFPPLYFTFRSTKTERNNKYYQRKFDPNKRATCTCPPGLLNWRTVSINRCLLFS